MKENGVPLELTYNPNYNLSFLIRKNLQYCMKTKKLREFLSQHLLHPSEVLGT